MSEIDVQSYDLNADFVILTPETNQPGITIHNENTALTVTGEVAKKIATLVGLDIQQHTFQSKTVAEKKDEQQLCSYRPKNIDAAEKLFNFPFVCNFQLGHSTLHSCTIVGKADNGEYLCFGQKNTFTRKSFQSNDTEEGRVYIDYFSNVEEHFSGTHTMNFQKIK